MTGGGSRLSQRLRRRELRRATRSTSKHGATSNGASATGASRFKVVRVKSSGLGGPRGRSGTRVEVPNVQRIAEEPLVSCLCVTENRHAFMPWLLWCFDRQLWRKRELVIVDSSNPPIEVPNRPDVRVVRMPLGSSLGAKRNCALDAARGEVIAWFDDDDWQHPKRLCTLVPLLREHAQSLGISFIGPSESYFIDLHARRCDPHRMHHYAVFNGSVFYRDMVRHARFDEHIMRTEDTRWIATLLRDRKGGAILPPHPTLFLWLSHEANISNTTLLRKLEMDAAPVVRDLSWAWGDTSKQLAALRQRLAARPAKHPARAVWAEGRPELAIPASHWKSPACSDNESTAPVAGTLRRGPEQSADAIIQQRGSPGVNKSAPLQTPTPAKTPIAAVYDLAFEPTAAPRDSRLLQPPQRSFSGEAQRIVTVAFKRKHEWSSAAYVGFLLPGSEDLACSDFLQAIEGDGARADAYLTGRRGRSSPRALLEQQENGLAIARHVLGKTVGLNEEALNRLMIIGEQAWVVRSALFADYARKWLLPVQRAFENRHDRTLRALLTEPGDSINARQRVTGEHPTYSAIITTLPAIAFHHDGLDVRAVREPKRRSTSASNRRDSNTPVNPKRPGRLLRVA